jgi:hypothetical protein
MESRPSDFKEIFDAGIGVPLRKRDALGRIVLLGRLSQWDPSLHSMRDAQVPFVALTEEIGTYEGTQLNGVCLLFDFKGLSFYQIRNISLFEVKRILNTIQVC